MDSAGIKLVLLTHFQNHFAGQPPAVLPRQGGVAQVDVVATLDGELQLAGILVAGELAQLDAAVAFGMSRGGSGSRSPSSSRLIPPVTSSMLKLADRFRSRARWSRPMCMLMARPSL